MAAYTEADVPNQAGKTALITGANAGIGYATARVLAGRGARVLLGCRSAERVQAAMDSIRRLHPGADLEFVPMDLSSLKSVAIAAAKVCAEPRLDLLINNVEGSYDARARCGNRVSGSYSE